MVLNSGDIIGGHYRIVQVLGSGGFGQTYLAEEMHLPNTPQRVVKEINSQSHSRSVLQEVEERFNKEVQALFRLGNHPQIPQLFAYFQENGKFYLVQEFIEGHPLSQELTIGRRLSEEEVINLLQGILEILDFLHQHNVIHRDIKPSNLIRRHTDGKIVLIDFGAVKEITNLQVSATGQVSTQGIGTYGYTPIEQWKGHPRLSSDIYAVGMVAIQAVTGLEPPGQLCSGSDGEIIWRTWAQVSDRLASILDKMVRYHFSERYQSAAEVLQALAGHDPRLSTKEASILELLGQAAITGSGGWLLAIALVSWMGTVWISAAFWLLISGSLIFGLFAKKLSIFEKSRFLIIAGFSTASTAFLVSRFFLIGNLFATLTQTLLVVAILSIISGLISFVLILIFQFLNNQIKV